jgi:hypothetical protein
MRVANAELALFNAKARNSRENAKVGKERLRCAEQAL